MFLLVHQVAYEFVVVAFAGDAWLGDGTVNSKSGRRMRKRRLDGSALHDQFRGEDGGFMN